MPREQEHTHTEQDKTVDRPAAEPAPDKGNSGDAKPAEQKPTESMEQGR